ncbi:MAG: hypothetical protein NC399_11360 [Muribaculum sp.]|nr:hypothetical protein [Muribaculum sp.]
MDSYKSKRSVRLLHKCLSWLLILGTVLSVCAGSSLAVSAEESGTYGYYLKYTLYSYNSSTGRRFITNLDGECSFSVPLALFRVGYGDACDPDFNPVSVPQYVLCYYSTKSASSAVNARILFSGSYEWLKDGEIIQNSTSYDIWSSPFPSFDVTTQAPTVICTFLDTDIPAFDDTEKLLKYFETGDDSGRLDLSSQHPDAGGGDSGEEEGDAWYKELIEKIKGWMGGMFEVLVRPLELLAEGINSGVDRILDLLPDKVADAFRSIYEAQKELAGNTFGKIVDLHDFLVGKAEEFLAFLKDIYDTLKFISVVAFSNLPQGIKDALEPLLSGYDTLLDRIYGAIDHLGSKFSDWLPTFNDVRDTLKNSRLKDAVDDLNKIVSLFSMDFSEFAGKFWEKYKEYSNPLEFGKDLLKSGFEHTIFYTLFVPSDEFLDEIGTDIHERFSGIFAMMDYVKKVINFLATCSGTKAPSFTVNLGKSASYYLGDSTVTIDFSWYEPYKPTVDLLFSAIIWAGFLWRMYSRIPEIIGGIGMGVSLPYRLEHYEVENERKQISRTRSDIRWSAWINNYSRRGRW